MNYELLSEEVKLVQKEFNHWLTREGMEGFQDLVRTAIKEKDAVKAASAAERAALPAAEKGFALRHLPDGIILGFKSRIVGQVAERVNAVFGPNSQRLANIILELPKDVEHIMLNLVLKVP